MSEYMARMALLRPYLSLFQRRFSVLDLGCGDGQISRAIASEYDAAVFCVDRGFNDTEEYSTSHYEGTSITCIRHDFTPEELARLADCEHFDVVLAFNFLHHFGWEWKAAAEAVLRMGCYVFVQLPRTGVQGVAGCDIMEELHALLLTHAPALLGETIQYPGHLPRPLWVFKNAAEKLLPRTTMFDAMGAPQGRAREVMRVMASHRSIICARPDKGERPWVAGMNLWNLLHIGVVRPSRVELAAKVCAFPPPPEEHGDIIPWNFIWDGNALYLCDAGGQRQREDAFGLKRTAEIVEMENPQWQ